MDSVQFTALGFVLLPATGKPCLCGLSEYRHLALISSDLVPCLVLSHPFRHESSNCHAGYVVTRGRSAEPAGLSSIRGSLRRVLGLLCIICPFYILLEFYTARQTRTSTQLPQCRSITGIWVVSGAAVLCLAVESHDGGLSVRCSFVQAKRDTNVEFLPTRPGPSP